MIGEGFGAHPRSRGADVAGHAHAADEQGSSPLARGGLVRARGPQRNHGLIPARAGRTRLGLAWHRPMGAHPRSRGADR